MQNRKVVMYLKSTGHEVDGERKFIPDYADNRITEIMAIEIINGKKGDYYHSYVNTEGWSIDKKAQKELGERRLEKISQASTLAEMGENLMHFIDQDHDGNTEVIVHNASYFQRLFDYSMDGVELDWNPNAASEDDTDADTFVSETEFSSDVSQASFDDSEENGLIIDEDESLSSTEVLEKHKWATIFDYCKLVDVTALAREVQPVKPSESGLVALCNRYGVNTSNRDAYSAKKDCELLVDLYLNIQQAKMELARKEQVKNTKPKQHFFFKDSPVVSRKDEDLVKETVLENTSLRHSS